MDAPVLISLVIGLLGSTLIAPTDSWPLLMLTEDGEYEPDDSKNFPTLSKDYVFKGYMHDGKDNLPVYQYVWHQETIPVLEVTDSAKLLGVPDTWPVHDAFSPGEDRPVLVPNLKMVVTENGTSYYWSPVRHVYTYETENEFINETPCYNITGVRDYYEKRGWPLRTVESEEEGDLPTLYFYDAALFCDMGSEFSLSPGINALDQHFYVFDAKNGTYVSYVLVSVNKKKMVSFNDAKFANDKKYKLIYGVESLGGTEENPKNKLSRSYYNREQYEIIKGRAYLIEKDILVYMERYFENPSKRSRQGENAYNHNDMIAGCDYHKTTNTIQHVFFTTKYYETYSDENGVGVRIKSSRKKEKGAAEQAWAFVKTFNPLSRT